MNFKIENYYFDYSIFIVTIIFIVLLISYRNLLFDTIDKLWYVLFITRLILLSMILVILVNPVLSFKKHSYKDISIVIDNSKSMLYNFSSINIDDQFYFNKIIKHISERGYNPILYKFSDKFQLLDDIKNIDYSGNLTDFSNMIDNLSNNSIVLTDGGNNHGPISVDLTNKKNINILGFGKDKYNNLDISIKLLSYEVNLDSILVNIELNNNLSSKMYNQGIYLTNKISTDLLIGKFDISQSSYKVSKSIAISKKNISKNNIIYIKDYINERNLYNNLFSINFENDFGDNDILFVSGSISSNTKYIKNNILSELSDYKINHIYRLNEDVWNKDINDIDYSDYELIVFDDFPKNKIDKSTIDYILDNYSGKISYFLGSDKMIKDNFFLHFCDCEYESFSKSMNNSRNNLFSYNDNSYLIPPLSLFYKILCPDNNFEYDNSHSFLYLKNNIALFFIPNIFEFNQIITKVDNKERYLVNTVFEDFIYPHSKYINIFSNRLNYKIGDTLNTFIEIKDGIDYSKIYIDIINHDNSYINKIVYDDSISNNLINIKEIQNIKGNFFMQAFLETDNSNLYTSNTIHYNVIESDIESQYIYLDESYLSDISNTTGGIYNKYSNVDNFLDNIDLSNLNSVNYQRNKIISYPFIFIVLISLFSFEWFLRNKIGLL
jgi:hypothetical protein